jgi:hypothetical protein
VASLSNDGMSVSPLPRIEMSPETRRMARSIGYGIAVLINLALIYIVRNITDWDFARFLTEDFDALVPLITVSLSVSVAVNVIYMFDDRPTIKSAGQIAVNLISIFVTIQILQVFPFDFSTYMFDWSVIVRVLLILAIVGSVIGTLAEVRKLTSAEPVE